MIKLLTVFMLIGGSAFAASPTCPGTNAQVFPFFCRGKMTTVLGDLDNSPGWSYVQITFSRFGASAGSNGASLTPGTCAWADRAMTAQEPPVAYTSIRPDDPTTGFTEQEVQRCAADASCVMRVNARNCGNGFLWFDPTLFIKYFPHG